MMQIAKAVLIAAVFGFGVVILLRTPDAQESSSISALEDRTASGGSAGGVALPAADWASRDVVTQDCSFFDPWRTLDCSPDLAGELLEVIRPLVDYQVQCLPTEWLLCFLRMSCEEVMVLSEEERGVLGDEIWSRGHILESQLSALFKREDGALLQSLSPALLPCLVRGSLPSYSGQHELAQSWGRYLAIAFQEKGSVFGANEEVLDALRAYMADWPIRDDEWWTAVWQGMADQTQDRGIVPVRLGIIEALHGRLNTDEWVDRVDKIASWERRDALGGSTLMGIGLCLQRLIPQERMAALLTEPISDSMRRSVILCFPDGLCWPNEGHAGVSEDVRAHIIALRDSPEFEHRLDIIQRQWELLGPDEAIQDLEAFAHSFGPKSSAWSHESALRLNAALNAMYTASLSPGNASYGTEYARELIHAWIRDMPVADLRRLLSTAQRTFWSGGNSREDATRVIFREVLGDDFWVSLPADLKELVLQ